MTLKIGTYHVLGTLGKGAHSTIQHIRRSADAKQYALKVVPLESKDDLKYLEQAKHEFRIAQMLDHPNLVKILAFETENDWLFRPTKALLLIEYVNGKTLDGLLPLSLVRAVQIFHRVADALVHCHRKGICHADIKPSNIMLKRGGQIKILDYGLSWIKGERKGRLQGTPEYMAPETARSQLVNEKSDIYNLGATMYRIVTGEKPPQTLAEENGIALDAQAYQMLFKPVRQINAKVPADLAELIEHCMAFNPPGRPNRMSEVQGALDVLVDKMVTRPDQKLEAFEID